MGHGDKIQIKCDRKYMAIFKYSKIAHNERSNQKKNDDIEIMTISRSLSAVDPSISGQATRVNKFQRRLTGR